MTNLCDELQQPGAAAEVVMTMKRIKEQPIKSTASLKKTITTKTSSLPKKVMASSVRSTGANNAYLSDPSTEVIMKSKKTVDLHLDANMAKYKM
jgi:hypothetical protein